MRRNLVIAATASAIWAGTASASDNIVGLWASPPDPKGQIGIVEVEPCGAALCGTLIRAFDPSGKEITTPNLGKDLIRDMSVETPGQYSGWAYVPLFGADFPARMELQGVVPHRVV